jgi:AraC-like DNA-binding protein
MQPDRTILRTNDLGEARELASALLYPHRLDQLDRSAPLDMALAGAQLGPICIADCAFGTSVRIECGDLGSYHVNVPVTARLMTTQQHTSLLATPSMAVVYRPEGRTLLNRWDGGRMLCIKIDKLALETTLAQCLGRDSVGPIEFDPAMNIGAGAGRGWAELVKLVNLQLRRRDQLINQPLVSAPLAKSVLTGLLTAASHPFREQLDGPATPCRPPAISRALEFMHEHAAEPITTTEIAAHCWVSVRSLQAGFQRHVGQPPLGALRQIRLDRARAELRSADPYIDSVGAIARRWGFRHLGRFAIAYRAAFGEPPSTTLHGSG